MKPLRKIEDSAFVSDSRGATAAPGITSLPLLNLTAARAQMLAYFKNGWALTELLFSGLVDDEAFYRRPYHKLRHPMIFYYVHPVALYVNKLRVAGVLDGPVNAEFEVLFETGVDEMRWDDLHEGDQDVWPPLEAARAYRSQVYDLLCNLIETHPLLDKPITQDSPMWALVMGFEHERIHLETSSVLMRELPVQYLRKPEGWPSHYALSGKETPANPMIAIGPSEVTLGKPQDLTSFGWDNEYGHETRSVRPFSSSAMLISNGEFLQFVKSGGYANEKYWSEPGWAWRRYRNSKWPAFWVQDGPAGLHQYKLRTIFEVIPMQASWPVCVNFHEAKAYCAFASERDGGSPYRLITEAEHHAMRDSRVRDASRGTARDMVMQPDPLSQGYNFNLATGAESPVDALAANDKGFHDMFGNVWQWCEDHFHPLEGSKPHAFYDDFSLPCYDGEHQMILGGSFISTGDEASIFSRFHFRPHFFQHAGFRIARSEDGEKSGAKVITPR